MKAASALRSFFAKPVVFFGTLYAVALTCSMAGMEITSWTTAFFVILYYLADRFCQTRQLKLHTIGVELPLFGLLFIIVLGLYLNHIDQDAFIYAAGSIRNVFLIYFFAYALRIIGNLNRTIGILITCATLVAGYAIWQHFTGIDLWRHNNRALVEVPWGGGGVYASVGFFSHHLTYGHAFMMALCFPWAALILSRRQPWWQIVLFVLSTAVILTSLIFCYSRGVWIAILVALPLMGFYASRKIFFITLGLLILVGGILYKTNPLLRERALTTFSANYESNEDRRKLWDINMEMLKDHPWIGVGYRQNESLSETYFKKLGIQDGMAGHAHSNYVEMLSTTGIIGFAFYMLFILAFVLMTARLYSTIPTTHYWHRVFALGALGAQIAFHVGGLTQWNFGDAEVQHQFFFWLAVVAYMSERYYAHIVPDDHSL